MDKTKHSSAIFFLLPRDVRYRVKLFLTSTEWGKLIKVYADNSPRLPLDHSHSLKRFIQQMGLLSKVNVKLSIPKCYLFLFLAFSILALIYEQYQVALYLFLYSMMGYGCMKKKNDRYWDIQFFRPKLEEGFIVFSVVIYIFLVLLMAHHTTDFFVASKWNYQPPFFFILQAFFFGPLFEEIFFRGYIFEMSSAELSSKHYREYIGIWVSSILFALIHLNLSNPNSLMGDLVVFLTAGLALGFLRWYTRSLLYCSIVHISFNGTMMLI